MLLALGGNVLAQKVLVLSTDFSCSNKAPNELRSFKDVDLEGILKPSVFISNVAFATSTGFTEETSDFMDSSHFAIVSNPVVLDSMRMADTTLNGVVFSQQGIGDNLIKLVVEGLKEGSDYEVEIDYIIPHSSGYLNTSGYAKKPHLNSGYSCMFKVVVNPDIEANQKAGVNCVFTKPSYGTTGTIKLTSASSQCGGIYDGTLNLYMSAARIPAGQAIMITGIKIRGEIDPKIVAKGSNKVCVGGNELVLSTDKIYNGCTYKWYKNNQIVGTGISYFHKSGNVENTSTYRYDVVTSEGEVIRSASIVVEDVECVDLNTSNIDFSKGTFEGWTMQTGNYYRLPDSTMTYDWTDTINASCDRFELISPVLSTFDPIIACDEFYSNPFEDSYTLRIGVPDIAGAEGNRTKYAAAENAKYTFTVNEENKALIVNFACVLHDNIKESLDSVMSHTQDQLPYFGMNVEMKSPSGETTTDSCGIFESSSSNNTFMIEATTDCPWSVAFGKLNQYSYMPWSSVVYDLTDKIGYEVTVSFTTHDCLRVQSNIEGAASHEAYGYFNVKTADLKLDVDNSGENPIVKAPEGFAHYEWSVNGNESTVFTYLNADSSMVEVDRNLIVEGAVYTCTLSGSMESCSAISLSTELYSDQSEVKQMKKSEDSDEKYYDIFGRAVDKNELQKGNVYLKVTSEGIGKIVK